MTTERLQVRILGRDYELDTGDLTPLEANHLAGYVDQKMRDIAEKFGLADTQKIAVLAALNIAFELTRPAVASPVLTPEDDAAVQGMVAQLDRLLRHVPEAGPVEAPPENPQPASPEMPDLPSSL